MAIKRTKSTGAAEAAPLPYAVADWRGAASYPVHRNFKHWAWEFTRRLPEYQSAWEGNKSAPACREAFRFGLNGRLIDPQSPSVAEILPVAGGGSIARLPVDTTVERWKHGNPKLTDSMILADLLFALTKLQSAGRVVITIDTWAPLEPQLAAIRRMHKAMGFEAIAERPHLAKWSTYCRVLDAVADGATRVEIAAAIYPRSRLAPGADGAKQADKDVRAARKILRAFAAVFSNEIGGSS